MVNIRAMFIFKMRDVKDLLTLCFIIGFTDKKNLLNLLISAPSAPDYSLYKRLSSCFFKLLLEKEQESLSRISMIDSMSSGTDMTPANSVIHSVLFGLTIWFILPYVFINHNALGA